MRLKALALILAGTAFATPGLAQPAAPPRVSIAVAPADVAAPPADATTTASGLAFKVLTPGTGTARPGPMDIVTVHFTGWTAAEGRLIDSSVLRGRPYAVALERLITGWSEGLQLMVEGEKRRLWIPPALAFEGVPDRPQGMVVFDVELVDILETSTPPDVAAPPGDAERTRSGLASKVLEPGTGTERPRATSTVSVHYSGWTTDGALFDSSVSRREPATFRLDEVIPGWTEGLQLMVEGEKRRFWIPQSLAYGGRAGAPAGLLVFDVMLIAVDP